MLLQSEILQHAKKEEVPSDTINKDWVLGCFFCSQMKWN